MTRNHNSTVFLLTGLEAHKNRWISIQIFSMPARHGSEHKKHLGRSTECTTPEASSALPSTAAATGVVLRVSAVERRVLLSGRRVFVALVQEFDTLHVDLGLGIRRHACVALNRFGPGVVGGSGQRHVVLEAGQ